jgi:penicillin-binding protein 1A
MTFLQIIVRLTILGACGALWLMAGVYLYLSPKLPDVETLRNIQLQTPMRVYTREGDLIGQFGEKKRNPLVFSDIPDQFVDALLAAEDDGFFQHRGIDIMGLLRAVSELVLTGEKGSGGSTLTMQVARNYFLTLDRTFIRKFNEILLALEIERALDKQEIFELYFNRIFLGHRAYGFEAAAQVYYGKGISELSLAQMAMLAGIPKAPSVSNPIRGPEAGKVRRNWILGRMLSLGLIDSATHDEAAAQPVTAKHHDAKVSFPAHYAAEMARQRMLSRYGMSAYNDGYHVYTTISSSLQQVAQKAVTNGLRTYDKRHGYRGPEQQLPPTDSTTDALPLQLWLDALAQTRDIANIPAAIVTQVLEDKAIIMLADGSYHDLLWENGVAQARAYLSENSRGASPSLPSDVLAVGDLIRTELLEDEQQTNDPKWHLTQIPAAQAALVSLDPNNGAIVSIVGGLAFEQSKFNRATQAERQPGSNFKPFIYSAAFDAGYTAASLINDAPVVFEDASLEGIWRPENDGGKFHGPTRLRWALTKSRNLVSIRLLQQMGIDQVISYTERFGFSTAEFSRDLSLALGTHAVSPLELASAYTVLANGGYRVEPFLIERIEDFDGETLYEATPETVCRDCGDSNTDEEMPNNDEMSMEDILAKSNIRATELPAAPRVMDADINYIIDSVLQDVITKGTARRALVLGRADLAGKTGTTNGPVDAWFSGYNADVVTTAWVGFDNYTPLGRREFGGTAALPVWIDYMREALRDSPDVERPIPVGVVSVKIDPDTGLLARPGQSNAILEYFRVAKVPKEADGEEIIDTDNINTSEDVLRDIF